jgi:hypothetical protein
MQFKIDENLPIEIVNLLINAGYEAKTVNEQKLKGNLPSTTLFVQNNED